MPKLVHLHFLSPWDGTILIIHGCFFELFLGFCFGDIRRYSFFDWLHDIFSFYAFAF